jgi:hypothetical protein
MSVVKCSNSVDGRRPADLGGGVRGSGPLSIPARQCAAWILVTCMYVLMYL